MYCVRNVTDDLYWVGGNDRRLALFEGVYKIPEGVSYNSYLLMDQSTVLMDTVDKAIADLFLENVAHVLDGRQLDYIVVQHMEPDHAATLGRVVKEYPQARIVCNAKIAAMIGQFFHFSLAGRIQMVAEGDTLCTGRHTLTFVDAPMVHWPEVMVTYDLADKILFSADAFGTFGALDGAIFADEVDFDHDYMDRARRYYTNIVGKYGPQVQAVLKKAAGLEIKLVCPLHGFVWRKKFNQLLEKYLLWSTYTPEEEGVMIAYASVYGNTAQAADLLASQLREIGVKVQMFDASVIEASEIVAASFRYSHLVFASSTYNAGIYLPMENLLHDIVNHNLQKRTVALIENGTWAPAAGGLMKNMLSTLRGMKFVGDTLTIASTLKEEQVDQMQALATALAGTMKGGLATLKRDQRARDLCLSPSQLAQQSATPALDAAAMFKLSYGLFVLTAKDGAKDNGCIINTVTQLTDTPKRITIAVNKANLTHDIILKTMTFNVSVLSEDVPFSVFQRFGFQSGRTADKFAGCEGVCRSANGVTYLTGSANAMLSGHVIATYDAGTHTLFVAEVTEAKVLSAEPSITYAYYFAHVKPKPMPTDEPQKGWVCKICGYIYEGETLPPDFICPLCKHGAADFEKLPG